MIKGLAKTGDRVFIVAVSLVVTLYIFFAGTIASGFMSYAIIGFAVAHVYWHRTPRDRVYLLLGILVLAPLYAVRHPLSLLAIFVLAGIASGLILAGRWSVARGEDRKRLESILCPPLMIAIFANIAEVPQLLTLLSKTTMDANLQYLDGLFGGPSLLLGRAVLTHPTLRTFLHIWYDALGLGLIAAAVPVCHQRQLLRSFAGALILSGIMGFLMYIVVPAVGPVHCMTEYPQQLSAPIPQPGVRNCFPSLHFSWALLMFAYARTRWTTILASAFVGMTVLATLGLGEHYLADLIVALPFAALVVLLERDRCLSRSSGLALAAVLLLTVVACAPYAFSMWTVRGIAWVSLVIGSVLFVREARANRRSLHVPSDSRVLADLVV